MSEQTIIPQPRIKITWLIGTMAAFAIFVVIGAYSSRMTWDTSDYDQDRAAQRYITLKKVQADENTLLYPALDAQGKAHAQWIDQANGVVRIPIDEAMAEEIDTLKAQPPAAGCEITPAPTPTAASAAAPASTNLAPATPAQPKPSNK
jgi:hypothetical protein